MSDLLSIQPLSGPIPAVPLRAAPVALPATVAFDTTLGQLLLPGGKAKTDGERQGAAEGGKDLPDEGQGAEALIPWMPVESLPLLPQEPVAPSVGTTPSANAIAAMPVEAPPLSPHERLALSIETGFSGDAGDGATGAPPAVTGLPGQQGPETVLAPAASIASAGASTPPVPATPFVPVGAQSGQPLPPTAPPLQVMDAGVMAPAPGGGPSMAAQSIVSGPAPSVPSRPEIVTTPVDPAAPDVATVSADEAPVDMAARIAPRAFTPGTTAPFVALQPAPPVTAAGPAAQIFAAAMSSVTGDTPASDQAIPVPVLANGATAEQLRTTVQAMSGADQTPLDLTGDDWTGRMIERIAALRDSAEAADTRIRLAPENLGTLDISIRRDGDRIHVHFAAENPAARQMLAEAAPRLAELADARGVKLGQTSVDAGTGGQQNAPRQGESQTPARPVSATARAEGEPAVDERIA